MIGNQIVVILDLDEKTANMDGSSLATWLACLDGVKDATVFRVKPGSEWVVYKFLEESAATEEEE